MYYLSISLNSSIRLNESLKAEADRSSSKTLRTSLKTTSLQNKDNSVLKSSTKSRPSSAGVSRKGVTVKTEMPFIVGKSTGKSFHVPSNIQKAVAMINKHSDIVSLNQSKRTSPHKKVAPKVCEKHPLDDSVRSRFFVYCVTYGQVTTVEDVLSEKVAIQETEEERQERETMEKMNAVVQSLAEEYEDLQK